jgi:hypothetical protein
MHQNFAPRWNGRYLSSNVNITYTDKNGHLINTPVGDRFTKFRTKQYVTNPICKISSNSGHLTASERSLRLAFCSILPEMLPTPPCKRSKTWSTKLGYGECDFVTTCTNTLPSVQGRNQGRTRPLPPRRPHARAKVSQISSPLTWPNPYSGITGPPSSTPSVLYIPLPRSSFSAGTPTSETVSSSIRAACPSRADATSRLSAG